MLFGELKWCYIKNLAIMKVLTVTNSRNVEEVLELEEGPLKDVLWVYLFHSKQVQDHVVRQVERRVHGVRLALGI